MNATLSLPARLLLLLLVLLLVGTSLSSCSSEDPLAADMQSGTPAIAAQAAKVQTLTTQLEQQKAVIETEQTRLMAIQEQLDGARQNLDGLKKAQAQPQ